MDEVKDLLLTWELPQLVPVFIDNLVTIQALSALTDADVKDLIPQAGPRALFTRCWRTWKNEFTPNITISELDLCQLEDIENNVNLNNSNILILPRNDKENQTELEELLKKSLESSSLLFYKGGCLDGDATRNLLASVIAKEILNEKRNLPIVGQTYFKWVKLIVELFPGEKTTTYYIPSCTTATGVVLQARGKLVHQVLNKRRRLQQLGSLTVKKRVREEEPTCSSPLSLISPSLSSTNDFSEDVMEDLLWLENSSEPWNIVQSKWKSTSKQRLHDLTKTDKFKSIDCYLNRYPALKKPHGYDLINIDFEEYYEDHMNYLFARFPVARVKLLELLGKKKSKDIFCQELICLAESEKEENKNLAAFLSIPYLLNTSAINQKKRKSSSEPGINWKPSKAETRDAFIKHVRSDAEIRSYVELRLRLLTDKGIPPQPYIIIVGESLQNIESFLVVVSNLPVIYIRHNIVDAVDTCYKSIWALSAEYGKDSYAIWYFMQRGIYKMTSKFDRGSTSVESLLTDCGL